MSDDVIIVPDSSRVIVVPESSRSVIVKQGESGPAGTPGLVWRGTWAGSTTYAANDVVYYRGSAWVASQSVAANVPPPEVGNGTSVYWEVMARGSNLQVTISGTAPPGPEINDIWIQV